MRRDNRRKASKRKSFEADKRIRSRSNSVNDSIPKKEEEINGVVVKDEDEEEPSLIINEENVIDKSTNHIKTEYNQVQNTDETEDDASLKESNIEERVEENTEDSDHEDEKSKDAPLVNGKDDSASNSNAVHSVERGVDEEDDEDDILEKDPKLHQKLLSKVTNEAVLRIYSSLNQLAVQALMNVKQEPVSGGDNQLPEKYMQNFLASLNGGFGFDDSDSVTAPGGDSSPRTRMVRPLAELSPDTFAKQMRYNDLASMVVCRGNNAKSMLAGLDQGASGSLKSGNSNSGQVGSGAGSGLHQFVTRYTIERPDDPSRASIEIILAGDDPLDPIIEVECGGNKGLLYVAKLCQGSKGQSILFNDEWLTPNEFQFISGRETAKDWKRSIRHCGKSLKTLMTKGILQVHPPVCECDYCKGQGPATVEKSKKRSYGTMQDRQLSITDTMRSGGSTTPSSTESVTPLSAGLSEGPSIALHKPGREGGLSSIITQLHNKKAICGSDARPGSREESLDLRVRASSSTSPGVGVNGRKRQREPGQRFSVGSNCESEEAHLPMKRRHSNEEGQFPVLGTEGSRLDGSQFNSRRKSPHGSEPLCLSSTAQPRSDRKLDKNGFFPTLSPKNDERNRSHDFKSSSDLGQKRDSPSSRKSFSDSTPPPAPTGSSLYPDFYKAARNYRNNMGYNNENAFLDAMKRAVANVTANAYPNPARTSPSPSSRNPSSASSLRRGGFLNLDSISRRLDSSSTHSQSSKDQPMVELTHHKMNGGRYSDHYDYDRKRNAYDLNNMDSTKAPVTVLHHHPNQFEPPLNPAHRQSGPHSNHFYGMPPPFSHEYTSDRRYGPRQGADRLRYGNSPGASLGDRKAGKNKNASRKHVSEEHQRRHTTNGDMPMLDLHNHAIPMLSLTYRNKEKTSSLDSKGRNETKRYNGSRNPGRSQSAFSIQNKTASNQRKAVSDDELSRTNDTSRRNSSSAPPPRHSDSPVNRSKFLDENNNEKVKAMKDEVFSRPRAKSASPNASNRPHPYLNGSRQQQRSSSSAETRPDSNLSCFQDTFESGPTLMQQYEMLRYRDICSAIENMGSWTTEDVCNFLRNIGCDQYQEVFRENGIDGDSLPLLVERHLVNKMGLKLGHALKIIARVHRRLGNHCAIIPDRFSTPKYPSSFPPFFPMTNSESSDHPPAPMNGFRESPELPKDDTEVE